MEVVVFGAGSLGSLIGGLLARAHDVTLVGRGEQVAAIRTDGLRIEGEHDCTVHPAATTDGSSLEADVALVTVKSFDTPEAAAVLASGSYDAICSLQNGMGNEATLAERCSDPVVAGTATYGAVSTAPGVVRCTGRGTVTVGALEPTAEPAATLVEEMFQAGNVPVTVAADMHRRLWEKLAVNAAVNPITALADIPNGAVLAGETDAVARAATTEVAATARAVGVDLADTVALERLEAVVAGTARNTSSMRQDVTAGRRTEIDAISGHVLTRATEVGVETPMNEMLASLVRAWERARNLR